MLDTRRERGRVCESVPAERRSTSPASSAARDFAASERGTDELNGSTIGIAWVRCGAVTAIRMPRSTALSWATPNWPLAR